MDKMILDRKRYGDYESGLYRGIRWEIYRPYGTYLCGKVLISDTISIETMDAIEERSHGGFTCYLGFSCDHMNDFTGSPFVLVDNNQIYRNRDYVLSCIHRMIEQVPSKHEPCYP